VMKTEARHRNEVNRLERSLKAAQLRVTEECNRNDFLLKKGELLSARAALEDCGRKLLKEFPKHSQGETVDWVGLWEDVVWSPSYALLKQYLDKYKQGG
jgi:hypothetical protein